MDFNGTPISVPLRRTKDGPFTAEATLNFLILDAPAPSTMPTYIQQLQRHKVKHLVRVCDKTYRTDVLEMAKITPVAFPFDDGGKPPQTVVDQWLQLIDTEIEQRDAEGKVSTIGIHCLAGLGRAPILVALALVEFADFQPLDAVGYIRERRNGAINEVQLKYIVKYVPRWKKQSPFDVCCSVM
jgi:protein tyrosine phosphatase type 4A